MIPTLSQRVRHIVGDAFGANIVEMNIEKALKEVKERAAKPESLFYNPMQLFLGREWLSKGLATANYQDLRGMARNPIIAAIIQTRLNQVAAFCRPRQKDYDLGFAIAADDPNQEGDEATIAAIRDWTYSMGTVGYGEPLLEAFARKFLADSLVLDQACAEIIYRRNGMPAYAVPVDGATIRRLKESLEFPTPGTTKPWYCQIMDDQIVNTYTRDDLIFAVRNPRTDINALGYGISELETLIRTVSTIINAEKYNSGMLLQGGTSKGVMVIKGDADLDQFNIFKRDFRESIRNAASQWRPPVLQVGKDSEVNWVELDRSNRDMEYSQLFDFLVKSACGVYQMDPAEINWSTSPTGATTIFNSNDQIKQLASKEKGLKPLLSFFANTININLIRKIDDRYHLEFVGFDNDRQIDVDILTKEVAAFKSLNEVRADKDLDPIEGGDIVLNQYYLQGLQMKQQDRQMKMQMKMQKEQQDRQDQEDQGYEYDYADTNPDTSLAQDAKDKTA